MAQRGELAEAMKRRGAAALAAALRGEKSVRGRGRVRTGNSRHQIWKEVKDRRLIRTGGRCEACGFRPPAEALLHLHHVQPKAKGGDDVDENALLLCPNCRAIAHHLYRQRAGVPPVDELVAEIRTALCMAEAA